MHNYLKQKSFAIAFPSFKAFIGEKRLNYSAIKKCISSSIQDEFNLENNSNNNNRRFSARNFYKKDNSKESIRPCLFKNDDRFIKVSKKNFYERKSLKWYWREKTYDMLDGDIYKNYLIKFKDSFHMELIPQNTPHGKTYDSCLIWLYDGDFPEYFIEHLLEFNNFPPKVFLIF